MNILETNMILLFFSSTLLLFILKTKITKVLFLIIISIQFIIINGLRDVTVGVDTFRYSLHFSRIRAITNWDNFIDYDTEIGYKVYQWIIGLFTSNVNMYLLLTATLLFTLLAKFIYKNSTNIFLSYFIFISLGFFDFTLSGIRQSIAMLIGLYTYEYALKKQKTKFLLVVLLAASFHYSALILLPIYFLVNFNLNNKYLLLIMPIYFLTTIFSDQIGSLLTSVYYGELSILDMYDSSGTIGTMSIFILIVLIIGYIFHPPAHPNTTKEHKALFNIVLFSFFIQTLSSVMYLFTRLNMNYLIFLIIYIPLLLEKSPDSTFSLEPKLVWSAKKVFYYSVVVVFSVYLIINIQNNAGRLLPYNFFWE